MDPRRRFNRFRDVVRDSSRGLDIWEAPRILGRDASHAYAILTREHADQPEPEGRLKRLWHRARIAFLGLSGKLTPPRRLLFVASLVAGAAGLYMYEIRPAVQFYGLLSPPVLLLLAITGLVFVLALELADRVMIRDELEVARQLQRELLPSSPPPLEGYAFSFSYRTANTIGGDYYDFLPLADGRIALVVGDASGHGIAAGLVMAIANAVLQLAIDLDPSPSAVAELMNRTLYRVGGSRAYMTLFYGVLEPARGRLEYVSVAHPFPIVRRADGTMVELGEGCLPLGVRPTIDPTAGVATLERGDLIVLYSDGVPEAVDASGTEFGFDRLRELIAGGGTAGQVHDRLIAELDAFTARATIHDDRSLVVVGRVG